MKRDLPEGLQQIPGNVGGPAGYHSFSPFSNEGSSNTENQALEEKLTSFFTEVCKKDGRSQYPSLFHQLYQPTETGGHELPLWTVFYWTQKVGQTRTVRDK